jgi:exonuclease SbcD
LKILKETNSSVWVEIIYTGNEIFPDFTDWTKNLVNNSKIEILKIQNRQQLNDVLVINNITDSLDELNTFDVFSKLLDNSSISNEQKEELKESYKEIIDILNIGE